MSVVQYHCGYKLLYLSALSSACLVFLCNAGNLVHLGFRKGEEPLALMDDVGCAFLHVS